MPQIYKMLLLFCIVRVQAFEHVKSAFSFQPILMEFKPRAQEMADFWQASYVEFL